MDKLKESEEQEADPRDIKGQKSLSDSRSFTYLPCAYRVPGSSGCYVSGCWGSCSLTRSGCLRLSCGCVLSGTSTTSSVVSVSRWRWRGRVREQQERTCRLRARWQLAYWERSCTKHRPGLVGERMGTLTAEAVDQLRLDAVRAEPWRAQGAH